jgi:hypothetical protein
VLTPGFLGGARIAAGQYQDDNGIFVTAGPGGGGRIQFFPFGVDGLFSLTPTLDDVAVPDSEFTGSVYVGAGASAGQAV